HSVEICSRVEAHRSACRPQLHRTLLQRVFAANGVAYQWIVPAQLRRNTDCNRASVDRRVLSPLIDDGAGIEPLLPGADQRVIAHAGWEPQRCGADEDRI